MTALETVPPMPTLVRRRVRSDHDLLTEKGARELAEAIMATWAKVGHAVRAWVERDHVGSDKRPIYVVRTDLKAGLPPGRGGERQ